MDAQRDKSIKKMAEMLLSGAKMLSNYCPVCSNPLFQLKDNRIYCASCQKEIIKEKSSKEKKNTSNTELLPQNNIEEIISRKMREILEKIPTEQDLSRLKKFFSILEKGLKILDLTKNS